MKRRNKILQVLLERDGYKVKYLKDEVTRIESKTFKAGEAVHIISNNDETLISLDEGKYELMNKEILIVKPEGIIYSIGKKQKESEILKALNARKK